jgi:flagellar motility protein MotE (MotC chaperone)
MTDETPLEIREEPASPPATRPERDMFDWINAASSVAVIILGLVTLWVTIRVSGLEDYFRSAVAQRNQEIVATSRELEATRLGVENTQRDLAKLKSQRDSLEKEIDQLNEQLQEKESDLLNRLAEIEDTKSENEGLLVRSRQIRAVADRIEKENALRDFYFRNFNADQTIRGTTQIDLYERIIANPGEELIDTVLDQYKKYPNENKFSKELMRDLAGACAPNVSNSINLKSMIIKPPTLAEQTRFLTVHSFNSKQEQNAYRAEEAAYQERKENYEAEIDERRNILETAKNEAYGKLYDCAADLLEVEPEEFDRTFGFDFRGVFDHYTDPYARSIEPIRRAFTARKE